MSTCGANSRNFSNFITQVAPVVKRASDRKCSSPKRDHRHTQSSVHPSNVNFFPWQFCIFFHHAQEYRLRFIPKSLYWVQLESDPHMYTFEWDRITGKALLDVIQILLSHHGSDSLFEPQEDHHLGVKYPLVNVSQFPVEHVQVILLQTRLCRSRKLLSLIHCDAGPANLSPTAPHFEFDSGGHKCELLRSGRKVVPAATTPCRTRDRASCTSLVAVFQRNNLIDHLCAHLIRSDPSVSMAFVVILPSLAMRFFHRSSSCCTAGRIRNSALQITASLSSRCTSFSDHLSSNDFQRSCTLCSRVPFFPSSVSERCFILMSTDSEKNPHQTFQFRHHCCTPIGQVRSSSRIAFRHAFRHALISLRRIMPRLVEQVLRSSSFLVSFGVVTAARSRKMNVENRWNVDSWYALLGLPWDVTERRTNAAETLQSPRLLVVHQPLAPLEVRKAALRIMVLQSAVQRVLTLLFMGRQQHLTRMSVGQRLESK